MKTVVIVDDQYTTRLILTEVVNNIKLNEPIKVKTFPRADDALGWLELNDVDLLLIDYMMDGMSGHEMLKNLKANRKFDRLPIIAMSSDNDVCVRYQFLEDGVTDFFLKPLDYHECMLRCRNLLD